MITKDQYMKQVEKKVKKKFGVGLKCLPLFNFDRYFRREISAQIAVDDFIDTVNEEFETDESYL